MRRATLDVNDKKDDRKFDRLSISLRCDHGSAEAMSLLPQYLLPLSAVTLGRFVISQDEPQQDYHDPDITISPATATNTQLNYDCSSKSEEDVKLATKLTSFLSAKFSTRSNSKVKITSRQAKTYYLHNVGQYFREAVKSEETQRWIVDRIADGDDKIYIITAFHTLLDAQITEGSGKSGVTGGEVGIPVSAALAASGVIIPMAETLDSGIGGSKGHQESEHKHFTAPGEQIFAVQYRKVKFKWFASKDVDHMILEKTSWWKRYDKPKSRGSKDSKDAIEVELEDEVDEADLRGDWFGRDDMSGQD